jgi:DNA-binding NtrC family response regulator
VRDSRRPFPPPAPTAIRQGPPGAGADFVAAGTHPSLLIVDDDVAFVRAAAEIARGANYDVTVADCVRQAMLRLERGHFDLALIDLTLPDGSGLDLIEHCDLARTRVVLATGHPTVESALRALRMPVLDYLVKPIEPHLYRQLLERSAAQRVIPAPRPEQGWHGLVGASPALQKIIAQVERVAPTDVTVLIQGESGVGKELVARAIHANSGRSGDFVALNCGAVAPELLASQLFGHERGSFTGAATRHAGYFEQARGGTLFLDEVTEMPLHLQVHLLRALENRVIRRVGGQEDIAVDARIVAATNYQVGRAVSDARLREDLYYRLGEFPILVPPLRERPEDIGPLAAVFLARLNQRYGTRKAFSSAANEQLRRFPWPGNIRELRNVVGRAYIMAHANTISEPLEGFRIAAPLDETPHSLTVGVGMSLEEIERRMLYKTLEYFADDKSKAARALGVSVKTIYNRLARYAQQPDDTVRSA